MKRNYISILLLLMAVCTLNSQIVITEISYNPPESGSDSLEYIEICNTSDTPIDLEGYSFTSGVNFTFPSMMINPGEYVVTCVDSFSLRFVTEVIGLQWESGALSNGGELIQLSDDQGTVIDEVDYDDVDDWPTADDGTDGEGSSIELCDVNSDNNIGTNWRAATNSFNIPINGRDLKGTPGAANTVDCQAAADHTISAEGIVFIPQDLTINEGETVRWVNNGGLHNVNGDQSVYPGNPESFSNGPVSSDAWTFDHTFNIAGSYDYQCDQHVGAGMVGTITVMEEMQPTPELIITEILYNDPGSVDSLDFIEIFNNGSEAVNMEGFYFTGVDYIFPAFSFEPGSYVIIAEDSGAVSEYFGVSAFQYLDGLSGSGEIIELYTPDNDLVDIVSYLDAAPWPTEADGFGYSLTLCNYNSDNNDPSNWKIASTSAGFEYMGTEIFANPGGSSYCNFDMSEATAIDADGVSILKDNTATLTGVVYGINYRPGGLQFALIDDANDGISLFSLSENFGYTVVQGDELRVTGIIDQFNGLIQIEPDGVELLSMGNALFDPTIVTSLGEETESQLVRMEDVRVLNTDQWTNGGSGFNVDMGNASDTITVRIDADTDIFGMDYPTGTFTVTGIGGQFDNSSPFTEGYQLLPRTLADIDPYIPFVEEFPAYAIGDVTTVNANGVADSLETTCQLTGIVYGVNIRPSGLQFTIIDEFGDGISIFNNTGDLGYTVVEGNEILVNGQVDQFFGLIQFNPVLIEILDSDAPLDDPIDTDVLNEDTESQLIRINKVLKLQDPGEWAGDGSSFNVTVEDVSDPSNVYTMRIDADVELSTMPAPTGAFFLTGIGGQFDADEPLDGGYQIMPRYAADIDPTNPTIEIDNELSILVYPNPVEDFLSIRSDILINQIQIRDGLGRKVIEMNSLDQNYEIDLSGLNTGLYYLSIIIEDNIYSEQIIKL